MHGAQLTTPPLGTLPPPSSTVRRGPQAPTASLPCRGSVLAQLGSRQGSGLLGGSLQDPLTLGRPGATGPETWMLLGGATAGAAPGEGEASLPWAASCSWAPVRRLCSRPHCGSRGAASGAPPLGPETAAWAQGLAAVHLLWEEPSASACVRPRHLGFVLPLTSDLAFLSERERSSLYSIGAGERRGRTGRSSACWRIAQLPAEPGAPPSSHPWLRRPRLLHHLPSSRVQQQRVGWKQRPTRDPRVAGCSSTRCAAVRPQMGKAFLSAKRKRDTFGSWLPLQGRTPAAVFKSSEGAGSSLLAIGAFQ